MARLPFLAQSLHLLVCFIFIPFRHFFTSLIHSSSSELRGYSSTQRKLEWPTAARWIDSYQWNKSAQRVCTSFPSLSALVFPRVRTPSIRRHRPPGSCHIGDCFPSPRDQNWPFIYHLSDWQQEFVRWSSDEGTADLYRSYPKSFNNDQGWRPLVARVKLQSLVLCFVMSTSLV